MLFAGIWQEGNHRASEGGGGHCCRVGDWQGGEELANSPGEGWSFQLRSRIANAIGEILDTSG